MAGFNDVPMVQSLAVPAVCLLIAFLGYGSQLVFRYSKTLQPGPLSDSETLLFNTLLVLLWITYYRAVSTDPGRYIFTDRVIDADGRWCNKCNAPKPPRAHHCRVCRRCVPKMDHHCPWTKNCVSMTTFPHFLRFLVYANISLWTLGYLLWQRLYSIWEARNLPAYLGPSLPALIAWAMLSGTCFLTSLALGIILSTTVRSWLFNCTMIEGWEIDRHEAIAERGGRDWWDVTDADGKSIRFEKVEFPYDIGFFANMAQAMGTSNILLWLFPFAGNPALGKDGKGSGWVWEENGFNRAEGMWPPPDPDKLRHAGRPWPAAARDYDAELRDLDLSPEDAKRAFQQRQEQDLRRKRVLMAELEEVDEVDDYGEASAAGGARSLWVNSDGERLRDYGVDDDDDDEIAADDEDVPLGELLRRRKVLGKDGQE
ncbi:DHHC palmitoyltransferase-domain-containing protein [Stachybotrys elegans]|uniref:Palmitoyltransferase PFA4 n=1 Tax=Stachybotrys elegans TaxID=80388 RepID=A0A8K0WSL0_9HYPO|nr:DHHC palmitoyltransferase-domain-containing protein [Stachybotrys elegans]